ncbi:MAG TPA: caspase family protein [Chloroflexia bacterium]|jgi:hypothetical protein
MYTLRAAVVIGINYNKPPPHATESNEVAPFEGANSITPLRYAEADAKEVGDILRSSGYKVIELVGQTATRRRIIEALRQHSLLAGHDGLLLAYFAGHGEMDPYVGSTAYLVPVDADLNALDATAIPLDELARHMESAGAAMTLLDCCHSGFAFGDAGTGRTRQARVGADFGRQAQEVFGNLSERIVLAACGGNQKARELDRFGHGAFTYYLLDHWRNNSEVDDLSLSRYVSTALAREGLPVPVRGGVQQGAMLLSGPQTGSERLRTGQQVTMSVATRVAPMQPAPTGMSVAPTLNPFVSPGVPALGHNAIPGSKPGKTQQETTPHNDPVEAPSPQSAPMSQPTTTTLTNQTPPGGTINMKALGIGVLVVGVVLSLCYTLASLAGISSSTLPGAMSNAWYEFYLTLGLILTPFALVGGGLIFLSRRK